LDLDFSQIFTVQSAVNAVAKCPSICSSRCENPERIADGITHIWHSEICYLPHSTNDMVNDINDVLLCQQLVTCCKSTQNANAVTNRSSTVCISPPQSDTWPAELEILSAIRISAYLKKQRKVVWSCQR